MAELNENNLTVFTGHSSKGNQLKWRSDGIWYKADYTGYEGLSEYMISHLLTMSNLHPSDYVLYDTEKINYKHTFFTGAKCENFLKENDQLITLARLYNIKYNRDFTKDIWHIRDAKDRLAFIVEQVRRMTNLSDFGTYLSRMLTVDALFLNEDRHLHNIAVIMKEDNTYDYCPLFDHGAGLLADTSIDYPLNANMYRLISEVKAKTISASFDEALDAAEELFGQNLYFTFSRTDVTKLLQAEDIYDKEIKSRVENIIFEQMRKYSYLMREPKYT